MFNKLYTVIKSYNKLKLNTISLWLHGYYRLLGLILLYPDRALDTLFLKRIKNVSEVAGMTGQNIN